jgi:hypothetical protein
VRWSFFIVEVCDVVSAYVPAAATWYLLCFGASWSIVMNVTVSMRPFPWGFRAWSVLAGFLQQSSLRVMACRWSCWHRRCPGLYHRTRRTRSVHLVPWDGTSSFTIIIFHGWDLVSVPRSWSHESERLALARNGVEHSIDEMCSLWDENKLGRSYEGLEWSKNV